MKERKKVAIAYDADRTLLRENHPNLILRARGIDVEDFWKKISKMQNEHKTEFPDSNPDIFYLTYMTAMASKEGNPLSGLTIKEIEQIARQQMHTLYYPGIPEFFREVKTDYSELDITHNIISLGITEMLRASDLGSCVDRIFANSLIQDPEIEALIVAGTDTSLEKDSAIKKISRGRYYGTETSGFEFPISQMICVGDGESDKEMFRQVLRQGGLAICVYDTSIEGDEQRATALAKRIKGLSVAPSEYRAGSNFRNLISQRLDEIQKAV